MASLSGNSSTGIPNWEKYVKNQTSLSSVKYDLEQPAYLYKIQNNTKATDNLGLIPAGSIVNIISPQLYRVSATKGVTGNKAVNNQPSARVRYDGKTGYLRITAIRKPTKSPTFVEKTTIELAQRTLDQFKSVAGVGKGAKAGIDIEIDGYGLIPNVTKVYDVKERINNRDAKADIALQNANGDSLFYISHKKGGGAKVFQQYGGISKKAGSKSDPGLIYNDPETQAYLNDVWKLYQDALGGAPQYGEANPFDSKGNLRFGRIYRFVKSPTLINRAVYGPDYGGPFGVDNVNLIGQGNFIYRPYMNSEQDISIRLSFTNFDVNGDISEFVEGDYRAIFVSRSETAKNTETPQGKISGLRSGIFNVSYLSGRSENIDALL